MKPCPEIIHHWWQWHPHIGVFIAILAALGIVVPLLIEKMGTREKIIWIFVLVGLTGLELRSITLDGKEQAAEQALAECRQLQNFKAIGNTLSGDIDINQRHFNETMGQFSQDAQGRQKQFDATMLKFSQTEKSNQARFKKLFAHEEQLAEAETGILEPDNKPTPPNRCSISVPAGAIRLLIDYGPKYLLGVDVVQVFPKIIVAHRSGEPILSMDRNKNNGNVALLFDLKSDDGKIIARLDESGFVVNRNNVLAIKEDKHSLVVTDLYGKEVLYVRYLNPTAILVKGSVLGVRGFYIGCATSYSRNANFIVP